MQGSRGKPVVIQVVVDIVHFQLAVYEDQGAGGCQAQDKIEQSLFLIGLVNPVNLGGRQNVSDLNQASSNRVISITFCRICFTTLPGREIRIRT